MSLVYKCVMRGVKWYDRWVCESIKRSHDVVNLLPIHSANTTTAKKVDVKKRNSFPINSLLEFI